MLAEDRLDRTKFSVRSFHQVEMISSRSNRHIGGLVSFRHSLSWLLAKLSVEACTSIKRGRVAGWDNRRALMDFLLRVLAVIVQIGTRLWDRYYFLSIVDSSAF
ncbi:hypothetical protein BJ912DRAFT_1062950 [Pholiota molesta]|nr:hypothetical protein BJ912DRAFT_1062950 [Pholiota molesta]